MIQVALLRGINVGGHHKVKMAELRQMFENLGYAHVQTYIQSGNVLFESQEKQAEIRARLEQEIERVFGFAVTIILRTPSELEKIQRQCPFSPEQIARAEATAVGESLYVSMLLEEPTIEQVRAVKAYETERDLIEVTGDTAYLLFGDSTRNSKLSTNLHKLGVSTMRNWKTLNKLISLAEQMESGEAI